MDRNPLLIIIFHLLTVIFCSCLFVCFLVDIYYIFLMLHDIIIDHFMKSCHMIT